MQRVTNCVLVKDDQVLLLQKPRRGWWVAPGGKMEHGESVKDSVVREYREETGIYLKNPALKGVFTFVIKEGKDIVSEWMMFTFLATEYDGQNVKESEEGIIEWHKQEDIAKLPMAPGDFHILDYLIKGSGMIFGTFTYTPDFELLSYRLDPN
ncbi:MULTISPECIES: 8-oxo-dGTP diphosphatase [Bacillaceae]|jgi:8-oxo-dGTP diphosphatase|uniref:8-oxo-dGTP diphosphatase n=1 Tax=Sutcliffiella horikoshii TaxID=79883 RepID=A0A5D4SY26_9BACI|nr:MULTISPECIES: 8-oxo-dGTP diphosphatase [Bacillaceae]MEA3320449.1 8-oxo-dGTP diphosphatase [Bacillota bacterium]KPB04626.1 NUDIX hydrolase [Bacillus sp. CHD6a]NLP49340.1 8-oxo-dGTP diphosphatase [Bacillus sp. RO1]NMH75265.1 8-oxo-dGTP diphosphatase [Bacillus sp. RO2]TYS66914.1 8-oxo-dGTP diphosphatase [Sutcliffiella horikoshii]